MLQRIKSIIKVIFKKDFSEGSNAIPGNGFLMAET